MDGDIDEQGSVRPAVYKKKKIKLQYKQSVHYTTTVRERWHWTDSYDLL